MQAKIQRIENGYSDVMGLVFSRVFSVSFTSENKVRIMEECDGNFFEELSKEEAKNLFKQCMDYIENNA